MKRVLFRPEARAEVLEAFHWYEEQRPGLGGVFRTCLDLAIERIQKAPLAYAVQHRDLRRALVDRFPYSIFYRVTPSVIVVVGVIHDRRHPREWKRRA